VYGYVVGIDDADIDRITVFECETVGLIDFVNGWVVGIPEAEIVCDTVEQTEGERLYVDDGVMDNVNGLLVGLFVLDIVTLTERLYVGDGVMDSV